AMPDFRQPPCSRTGPLESIKRRKFMSMSRRTMVLLAVGLSLVAVSVFAQNGKSSNWRVNGDNGELVKVLPSPAAVQAQENHSMGTQIHTQHNGHHGVEHTHG